MAQPEREPLGGRPLELAERTVDVLHVPGELLREEGRALPEPLVSREPRALLGREIHRGIVPCPFGGGERASGPAGEMEAAAPAKRSRDGKRPGGETA